MRVSLLMVLSVLLIAPTAVSVRAESVADLPTGKGLAPSQSKPSNASGESSAGGVPQAMASSQLGRSMAAPRLPGVVSQPGGPTYFHSL